MVRCLSICPLLAATILAVACERDHGTDLHITVAEDASPPASLELRVHEREVCIDATAMASSEPEGADLVHEQVFSGPRGTRVGELGPGTHAFAVLGRDGECEPVLFGCATADVRSTRRVRVELRSFRGRVAGCGPERRCAGEGRCEPGTADAGPMDATPRDTGPPDTGPRLWVLAPGSTTWTRPVVPGSGDEPAQPVRAAFDVDFLDEAYVLTSDTYHRLELGEYRWVESGSLEAIGMGEVQGASHLGANSTPARHPDDPPADEETIILITGPGPGDERKVHVYDYATGMFSHADEQACCATQWTGDLAPQASDVRAMFLDVDNTEEWIASMGCSTDVYAGVLTASTLHIEDAGGACGGGFVQQTRYEEFPPMGYDGAPPADEVGATFWNLEHGLHVIRAAP